jgi:hypothetical protein
MRKNFERFSLVKALFAIKIYVGSAQATTIYSSIYNPSVMLYFQRNALLEKLLKKTDKI